MVDVSAVALSGLFANEKRLSVAANNIANANTDGFKTQSVVQSANATGGVSTSVVTSAPSVNPPAQPANTNTNGQAQAAPSDVDIATQLVDTNVATYSAQANLKVLQTQDKLNKYLLDIQA